MNMLRMGLTLLAFPLASILAHAEHTAPVYDVDTMSSDTSTAIQQDEASKPSVSSSTPSSASSPSSTSTTTSIVSSSPGTLEQRLERLEQQLENAKQNDQVNRVSSMQTEIQSLRGQVEDLTHQLQELGTRSHEAPAEQQLSSSAGEQSMSSVPREGDEDSPPPKTTHPKLAVASLENQARSGEAHSAASTKLASTKSSLLTKEPTAQPNVAEEQAVYQTAYNLIKNKKYNDAISALQKMLIKYPSGQFAANAHYWLGELYSLTGENDQAAAEFNAVVKRYPNNARIADAQLKLGLIYATQLKWSDAKTSFKIVINQYPGTASARLAQEQLRQIKEAGH